MGAVHCSIVWCGNNILTECATIESTSYDEYSTIKGIMHEIFEPSLKCDGRVILLLIEVIIQTISNHSHIYHELRMEHTQEAITGN